MGREYHNRFPVFPEGNCISTAMQAIKEYEKDISAKLIGDIRQKKDQDLPE